VTCCQNVYSGTFTYTGNRLTRAGCASCLSENFIPILTATLDFAYGGVLDLSGLDVPIQDALQWITTQRREAVAAKFSGTLHRTHTR